MCTASHCGSVSTPINNTCKKNGWPVNHLVLVCDPVTGDCCNCTCSCLAYGTPVAIPSGTKAIQTIALGDQVLAADTNFQWTPMPVEFSDGTGPDSVQPQMVFVTYGQPEQTIIVTLDHTFLQAGGKLIRANMLIVGDSLLGPGGEEVKILNIQVKNYVGGVWNIATSHEQPTSLNGHLINTQGVISGDYAVQLFYDDLSKQGFTVAARKDTVGTDAHRAAAGLAPRLSLPEKPLSAILQTRSAQHWPNPKIHIHLDHSFVVAAPTTHQGYLTTAQATEVRDKIPHRTFAESARVIEFTRWAFTLFSGFYPDVNFILDWPNANANVFSVVLDEQKNVLIQGGLLRAMPINWESITVLLAYSVNRFREDPPDGADGLLCKPQCDYDVIPVLMNVFYPLYPNVVFNAVNQMEALFKDIPTKHDAPSGQCHATTLECRIQTYRNSMSMLELPECAGGIIPSKSKK
jgi:hypothetical protein